MSDSDPPTASRRLETEDEELLELQHKKQILLEKKRLREEIKRMEEEEQGVNTSEKDKVLMEYMSRNCKLQMFPHLALFDMHLNTIEKFNNLFDQGAEQLEKDLERQFINKMKIGSMSPNDALVVQYLFSNAREKLFLIYNLLNNRKVGDRMLLHNAYLWKEEGNDFESNRAKLLLSLQVPLLSGFQTINEKILDIEEKQKSDLVGGEDTDKIKNKKKKFAQIFDIGNEERIITGGESYHLNVSPEGTVDMSEVRDVIFQIQGKIQAIEAHQQHLAQQNEQLNQQRQQAPQNTQWNNNKNNYYNHHGRGRGNRGGRGNYNNFNHYNRGGYQRQGGESFLEESQDQK